LTMNNGNGYPMHWLKLLIDFLGTESDLWKEFFLFGLKRGSAIINIFGRLKPLISFVKVI